MNELADLILDIDALEEANRPFSADLPREFLDAVLRAEPPTDFHAAGAAHLSGRTTKMGRDVLVQAKFALPLSSPCKRCLEVVALIEPVELVRTFVPRGASKVETHEPEPKRGAPSQQPGSRKRAAEAEEPASPATGGARKRAALAEEPASPATGGTRKRAALVDDAEADGSFALEEADEDTYEGKELDLRPAVREQILLSLPPAPLCSEDCKGLCPRCGKDLNEGECGCDRTVMDPRWAALKGIQLESKKEK